MINRNLRVAVALLLAAGATACGPDAPESSPASTVAARESVDRDLTTTTVAPSTTVPVTTTVAPPPTIPPELATELEQVTAEIDQELAGLESELAELDSALAE